MFKPGGEDKTYSNHYYLNFKLLKSTLNNIKGLLNTDNPPSLIDFSEQILELSKKYTGSEKCYVAYVDPENGDSVGVAFSHVTSACKDYQKMGEARFKVLKDGSYGGLLGFSLDTGVSFFTHDPKNHPVAHGIPEGHEPIDQFLSIAVKIDQKVVGQIALANPIEPYNNLHLKIGEEIGRLYAEYLDRFL